MKHYLTYKELMDLALKHYNEGGDSTYECLDEKTFNENYSKITEKEALEMFRLDEAIRKEYYACEFQLDIKNFL